MKVLIGTPVHVSKDYSMERWLNNVSRLKYPADLLIVDNSPSLNYVEKIKVYCKKYGIKNYTIKHLGILQGKKSGKSLRDQEHERIARSREIIRHEVLSKNYDAWFCWESDQIIPTDALDKLIPLMESENFMAVVHNCWINNIPNKENFDYGVVLFSRECLKKYSFLLKFDSDPQVPDYWYYAEDRFRRRLQKDGCNYIEVSGLIEPVYHLNE